MSAKRVTATVATAGILLLAVSMDASANRRRANSRPARGYAAAEVSTSTISSLFATVYGHYGQSNSAGSANGAICVSQSNTSPVGPPYNNYWWDDAYSSTLATYCPSLIPNGEYHWYGMADQLSAFEYVGSRSIRRTFHFGNGVGAQTYAQLAQGTANWTTLWTEMDNAFAECEAYNEPTYTCRFGNAFVWLQGENDQTSGTTRAQYVTNLLELYDDVCTEAMASPLNASRCPAIVVIPYAAQTRVTVSSHYRESSEIVGAHYEACRDYPTQIVCAHPGYATPIGSADVHYTPAGHAQNGKQIARAVRAIDLQNGTFSPLMPSASAISCTDNVVTIPITGGENTGLSFDTTNVTLRPHYGFEYFDNQADVPAITAVAISGENITLTLNRNCNASSSGWRVRYAWSADAGCNAGSTSVCGTGGNVRRTTGWTDNLGTTRYYWLQPFDQAFSTVSGSASSAWTFANATGSLDVPATGNHWFSAHSSTVGWGAANFTVAMRYRSASTAVTGRVLLEIWSPVRLWSLRSAASGALQWFLSADGTTSVNCSTAASTIANSTDYVIVAVKQGTSATLYINDAAVTCSFSGAVPATLHTTGYSAITMLGSTGAANPNSNSLLSHVGIWNRALSSTEVASLRSGGDPTDYRALYPAHYWHGQGSGEDVGLAASRPLYPYNGAVYTGTAF